VLVLFQEVLNLDREIGELKTSDGSSAHEKRRQQLLREKSILEAEKLVNEGQLLTVRTHVDNLTAHGEHLKSSMLESKAESNSLKDRMAANEKEIKSLGRQGINKYALFGEKMAGLVSAIQDNCERFKRVPIGPLGSEIKLSKDVSSEEAKLIEHELKDVLSSFVVEDFTDKQVLNTLQKKFGTNYRVIKSACRFDDNRYDVTNSSCTQFKTIYEKLILDSAVVANCILDLKHVENVIIIPTDEEAQSILGDVRTVPKNCNYALTNSGYQYYPAPNYRSYAIGELNKNLILQASVKEYVSELKKDGLRLQEQLAEKTQHAQEIKTSQGANNVEVKKERDTCTKISEMQRKVLNQIQILQTALDVEKQPNVSALEEDRDKLKEKMSELQSQIVVLTSNDVAAADVVCALTKGQCRQLQNEITQIEEKGEPLGDRLAKLESEAGKCERNKEHYIGKRSEYMNKLDQLKEAEMSKKVEYDARSETARQHSSLETSAASSSVSLRGGGVIGARTKKPETVHREIQDLERSLRTDEGNLEERDVVCKNLVRSKSLYSATRSKVKQLECTLRALSSMLDQRRNGFLQIRGSVSRRVKLNFALRLQARKYSGEISFDHKKKELCLTVCPEGGDVVVQKRDMKTLSGGEKSYSTISLILSLWESMQPPFRVLDEFDVFMDMLNRRVALQQIIDYAKESKKFQYIFLTPLNTDCVDIKSGDVSVVRLQKNQ
jgi:chromosome segregation ATPase